MLKLLVDRYRIYLIIAAGVASLTAGVWLYNTIYDRGWDARGVVAEQEKLRQREANEKAIQDTEKALRDDIAKLKNEKEALRNEVATLDAESSASPDAHRSSLPAARVRRLNAIR